MSCPGDALSGLVDGELDHAPRERVLSHVMSCPDCQGEVAELRRLKTQLSWVGAETPTPSPELASRLLRLAVSTGADVVATPRRPRFGRQRARPPGRGLTALGPGRTGPASTRRLRRRAVGGLLALGLGAAFVLGGPASPNGPRAPVDPATDQFVTDYVNATVEVPITQPVSATVVGSAR